MQTWINALLDVDITAGESLTYCSTRQERLLPSTCLHGTPLSSKIASSFLFVLTKVKLLDT